MTQIHPLKFFEKLVWIDKRPLLEVIEGYRKRIFEQVLFTLRAGGLPQFNMSLTGRGKKNWKSGDLILAGFYRLVAWKTTGGNDCLIVAFDEDQAGDDLDLAKKLVKANPVLRKALAIKRNEIARRDGEGFLRILPGKDTSGQHGKSFLFLGVDELHSQRDWSLLEGLQLDPHRADALQWLTSYDTLLRRPGVPIFDLMTKGKRGNDQRFYFSWYAADYCTDPTFANLPAEQKANPSMASWPDKNYLEQQRSRLPVHLYRRLHLNVGGQPTGAALAAEKILENIDKGVKVRPPVSGIDYSAACDMSDGANDDAVLAIGHVENERTVVDLVMDQGSAVPFDPLRAVKTFAAVLKQYHVAALTLDRFAHNTFSSAFAEHEIDCNLSELTTHQSYESFSPRLNSGQIVLLDNEKLESQLLSLLWRGARIDHPGGEHDDYAAAVARLVGILSDDGNDGEVAFFDKGSSRGSGSGLSDNSVIGAFHGGDRSSVSDHYSDRDDDSFDDSMTIRHGPRYKVHDW